MAEIYDQEQLEERARSLTVHNGFERLFVTLDSAADPPHAWLEVHFYNNRQLDNIQNDIDTHGILPSTIFPIQGGVRIPAGSAAGRVQVVAMAPGSADHIRRLKVQPIGDYATYTLNLICGDMDPLFSQIDFKFRPGCFNTNCAPVISHEARDEAPAIDYLAKDFDSFKHVLINAMQERVPGWQPTSEADLDQVLIDLIAADADELSDFQDRVMNEAYFGRARKRVSLARHARLMDYHIHQGNQAGTLIAVNVGTDHSIPKGFGVWTGKKWQDPEAVIFTGTHDQACFQDLNTLDLYTWNGIVMALESGSTRADIVAPGGSTQTDADDLRDLLRRKDVTALVIEEKRNPETGTANGRDKTMRQVLRLLDADAAATTVYDPVHDNYVVRVEWRPEDKLKNRYCFVTRCPGEPAREGVSVFHGNLIHVTHGRPHKTVFHPPLSELDAGDSNDLIWVDHAIYEETDHWGTLCRLPHGLLAYGNTRPGGEMPVRTTLTVTVNGIDDPWQEQSDLIESKSDDNHFVVETDEYDVSTVRFGNGVNGRALPADAVVSCTYQVGRGSRGNVGADTLTGFDNRAVGFPNVTTVHNPLDVTDGRDPEKHEEIIRRVPQAYGARQLRAVTLSDYTRRAEELPEVAHAFARYAWTGSWRTVRVAIDPKGTTEFSDAHRQKTVNHLDAVRLIGEDLEVRAARYVALDIFLQLCAHPDYWPEDLACELAMAFSTGHTPDGRQGFFHPDGWTFGQPLHASHLVGRAFEVTGIERVTLVSMRRWQAGRGSSPAVVTVQPEDMPMDEVDTLAVAPFEIIQVANDPSQLENGRIQFDIQGGRR